VGSTDDDHWDNDDSDEWRADRERRRDGDDEHHHHRDAAGADVYKWTGNYGFAMTSLKAGQQMTQDEAKWISSCMLAFVNMKGTHQYISLRANPPNIEAQQALLPTQNERWIMGRLVYGAFFADLTHPIAPKFVCTQSNVANIFARKEDVVLGRTCDVESCTFTDASQNIVPLLTEHIGSCWYKNDKLPDGSPAHNNWLRSDTPTNYSAIEPVGFYQQANYTYFHPDIPWEPNTLHPIFVNGPELVRAAPVRGSGYWVGESAFNTDVAGCGSPTLAGVYGSASNQPCYPDDAHFTVPIDNDLQEASCGDVTQCLSGAPAGFYTNPNNVSNKLVNLVDGQAADYGVRFVADINSQINQSVPGAQPLLPDMSDPFTAIVRYSKPVTGSANLWVTRQDGSWRNVTDIDAGTGPDIWAATGLAADAAPAWEWMQVYPAYLSYDKQTSAYLGRYCSTTSDCAPGLGLSCHSDSHVCMKDAAVDPTNATPPACDGVPGQLKLFAGRAVDYLHTPPPPRCIEQCTADTQCGLAGKCMSGQCVQPAIKARLSGAYMSESCSGPELFRGAKEQGACSKPFPGASLKNGAVCPKDFEVAPACRGALVWTRRKGVTGWFCRGGGEALYACTAADAPDLDAVAFIPGKPWCAPEGATSFVGVCK
jgi:hypothetical protein